MRIDKDTKAQEVKEFFKESFEGLKIEFFNHAHEDLEGSPKGDMINNDFVLSDRSKSFENSNFHPVPITRVNEIEDWFEDKIGIHAQIFRKAGSGWVETTKTDHYSLQEQMEIAN